MTVPRGFQRTWPNALTFEGVYGAEHAKSGHPIDPAHDVDLVFTRNAVGSMDYTPAALSARGQRSTMAHRLAQAIAFESGLQHYADRPESYAAHPAALALLEAAPAAWDDTRLLAGAPGTLRHGRAARGGDVVRRRPVGDARADGGGPARASWQPGRSYAATVITDDGAGGLAATEQRRHGRRYAPGPGRRGRRVHHAARTQPDNPDAGGRDSVRVP